MLQTASTSNYSRADIVAMLSALPKEEQRWTWNYLNSIIVVQPVPNVKKQVQMKRDGLIVTPFVASLSANIQMSDINEKEEGHKHLMEKYG